MLPDAPLGADCLGAPVVTITPQDPHSDQDLEASTDAIGATWTWTLDDAPALPGFDRVPAVMTTRGDVWEARATANGLTGKASVTIGNTPPTVTVDLEALPDEAEHPGIRLSVEDEGEGIPEELRRRVFTKFWTSGVRGGSGLGMYLVNGLTRAHGGTIVLGDAASGGARVVVEWPAARIG